MKKIKYAFFASLLALSSSSFASNSSFQTRANVQSGCSVSGENFDFGVIVPDGTRLRSNANLYVQCSKGITVTLNGSSKNQRNGTMYHSSITSPKDGYTFPYQVETADIVSNSHITITKRPNSEIIWDVYTNALVFRVLTADKATLPFYTIISPNKTNVPGDYSDDITYHLTF